MEIKTYLNEQKAVVENALEQYTPLAEPPFTSHLESMRYSLFVGGKRIRPILCLAAGEAVSDKVDMKTDLLPICCALECIHTYSLIHDDLPAMDNDDLRRGKPTNHKVYGEAGAILAGDGLLTWAFDLLSQNSYSKIPAKQRLQIIQIISRAAGSLGMVGGQALDIEHENKEFPFEMLKTIHRNKTGALITASVLAGAVAANANQEQLDSLKEYGDQIGLAFQIVDDLLDVISTTEELGKAAGSDQELGKATYPAFFGVEETRNRAVEAVNKALASLEGFDHKAEPLRLLAKYIYDRTN